MNNSPGGSSARSSANSVISANPIAAQHMVNGMAMHQHPMGTVIPQMTHSQAPPGYTGFLMPKPMQEQSHRERMDSLKRHSQESEQRHESLAQRTKQEEQLTRDMILNRAYDKIKSASDSGGQYGASGMSGHLGIASHVKLKSSAVGHLRADAASNRGVTPPAIPEVEPALTAQQDPRSMHGRFVHAPRYTSSSTYGYGSCGQSGLHISDSNPSSNNGMELSGTVSHDISSNPNTSQAQHPVPTVPKTEYQIPPIHQTQSVSFTSTPTNSNFHQPKNEMSELPVLPVEDVLGFLDNPAHASTPTSSQQNSQAPPPANVAPPCSQTQPPTNAPETSSASVPQSRAPAQPTQPANSTIPTATTTAVETPTSSTPASSSYYPAMPQQQNYGGFYGQGFDPRFAGFQGYNAAYAQAMAQHSQQQFAQAAQAEYYRQAQQANLMYQADLQRQNQMPPTSASGQPATPGFFAQQQSTGHSSGASDPNNVQNRQNR